MWADPMDDESAVHGDFRENPERDCSYYFGKKPVKFKLKKELKKTSKKLIKNKKEPKYKKVFKFALSGFKKFILDIIFPVLLFFYCTNSLKLKSRYLELNK